ncbi:MAG: type II toxin-antitoxin system RelE/ParE family toxin [Anaerolineae bacterium]
MNNGDKVWRIIIRPKVKRRLKRLPVPLKERLSLAIDQLAVQPRPIGSKKLAGGSDLYRIRVGDWRIIYDIKDDQLIIIVINVASRGDAYRNL